MTEKSVLCILIINFILFCCNLAFTIGGSIILNQSNKLSDTENQFFDIWLVNLVLTCISGFNSMLAVLTCFGLTEMTENKKTNTNQILELLASLTSIWLIVLFFSDFTDLDSLISESHNLYLLTAIRVIYSLVLFSIGGLILVISCLFLICGGMYFMFCLPSDDKLSDSIVRQSTQPPLITRV